MTNSDSSHLSKGVPTKSLWLPTLLAAIVLGYSPQAGAGQMHARAVIGLGVHSQFASHGGVAHASRQQGSKYRVAHEELGNNYTYGNAGSGHAHHHSGFGRMAQETSGRAGKEIAPPRAGSQGSSQYVKQTWLPTAKGDKITVAWSPESFLQVDLTELARGQTITSGASLAAASLSGAVKLSAWLDKKGRAQTNTQLTGVFKGVKFELVSHPNRVVSLQFRQPLAWTVAGKADTFDIALDGSIDIGSSRAR